MASQSLTDAIARMRAHDQSSDVRAADEIESQIIELLDAEQHVVAVDSNVESVRHQLLQRSATGLKKYGVTTERTDLNAQAWLQHLLEELLDAAVYVERIKAETRVWIPVTESVPVAHDASPHFSIEVWAIIDDADAPFADVAAYWPALKKWTVTHSTRADQGAADFEAKVTHWMPLPKLPEGM